MFIELKNIVDNRIVAHKLLDLIKIDKLLDLEKEIWSNEIFLHLAFQKWLEVQIDAFYCNKFEFEMLGSNETSQTSGLAMNSKDESAQAFKNEIKHAKRLKPNLIMKTSNLLAGNIDTITSIDDSIFFSRCNTIKENKKTGNIFSNITNAPNFINKTEKPSTVIEDHFSILTMVEIYAKLVIYRLISIENLIELVLKIIYINDDAEILSTFFQTSVSENCSLIINYNCVQLVFIQLFQSLFPIINNFGVFFKQKIYQSKIFATTVSKIKNKNILMLAREEEAYFSDNFNAFALKKPVFFKMPDTFLKPFNDDTDSRYEYKSTVFF
jgi:hypothetical protein